MLSCSEDLPREAVRVPLRAAGAGVVPRGWRELRPSVRRVVVCGNEVEWDGLLLAGLNEVLEMIETGRGRAADPQRRRDALERVGRGIEECT